MFTGEIKVIKCHNLFTQNMTVQLYKITMYEVKVIIVCKCTKIYIKMCNCSDLVFVSNILSFP